MNFPSATEKLMSSVGKSPKAFFFYVAFLFFVAIPSVSLAAEKDIDAIHHKVYHKIIPPIGVPPSIKAVVDVDVQETGYVSRVVLRKKQWTQDLR